MITSTAAPTRMGRPYIWIGGQRTDCLCSTTRSQDFDSNPRRAIITITPLSLDMTDYALTVETLAGVLAG
jgi:hypothetical protein